MNIHITTAYGSKTHEPIVNLVLGDSLFQFKSGDARELGQDLIDASHAATVDAFLMEWFNNEMGVPEEKSAIIMDAFRQWKQKRSAKTT